MEAATPTGRRGRLLPAPAVALGVNDLGVSAPRRAPRAILTSEGLVAIMVVDRFTELAIDLHWTEIADVLGGEPPGRLMEFRGFKLDGHQLAFAIEQIPAKNTGMVR